MDKVMIWAPVALSDRIASVSSKEGKPEAWICVSISPVPDSEGLPDQEEGERVR